jgi:LAO/AO transport system kinase
MSLSKQVLRGDLRAIARLISFVEDEDPGAIPDLKAIYPRTGSAKLIGITGPAGAGKSSLINLLIREVRKKEERVGVLAVDPTSPFSGGSLLGDRLRMRGHLADPKVFIRSLASRGGSGGVAYALPQAIRILDAGGFRTILIETVGAGQDEIAILGLAGVVLVVLAPHLGDEVQALKAGLLEIGDLLVLNKSDLPESRVLEEQLLQIGTSPELLLRVSALKEEGIGELAARIDRLFADRDPKEIYRRFCRWELLKILEREWVRIGRGSVGDDLLNRSIDAVARKAKDPYAVAADLARRISIRKSKRR